MSAESMLSTVAKMNNAEILNPKSMVPNCAELWEWYKTISPRIKNALINRDGTAVEDIADEIEAHKPEIEYLTRM